MAQSSRYLVGTTEDLIDQILFWIYAECSRDRCDLDHSESTGCEHMHNLANLLTISRLWSEIVVKVLWDKCVTWDALQELVCGPRSTWHGPEMGWITHQHLNLWERYSGYITKLVFGDLFKPGFDDIPFQEILISFLELGALSHNKPLLPRVTSLTIRDWYALKGFHLLVGLFLSSPSVTKIILDFGEQPLSQQVFRNMSTIAQKLPALQSLTVHYRMRLPPPTRCPLLDSFTVLGAMETLEELVINPVLINLPLFDTIGELKHLKSLKLCGYPSASEFAPSNSGAGIRSGKFPVLEALDVEDKVTTINGILGTYFLDPSLPLNALLVTISHGPMTDRHFAIMEKTFKRCEKLHIIFNNNQNEALRRRHLSCLSDCRSLTEFVVTHPTYISVTRTEASEIFKACTNLRILRLTMFRKKAMNYAEFKEITQDRNPRLDISCLDGFAAALPRLRHLELSVLACDTSSLPSGQALRPFERLDTLHLSNYSLLNWNLKVIPFDQHQAAGYISALLRPDTDFRCPTSLPVAFPTVPNGQLSEPWGGSFTKFIRNFEQQVKNYVKIRADQTVRIRAETRRISDGQVI